MKDKLISEHRFVEDLYGCLDGFDFDLEDVLNVLKGVEPVDAVEVVRCENCKFHERKWCTLHDTTMFDKEFCSDGERKEGEQDVESGKTV